MGFSRLYKGIKDMILEDALDVQIARDIVRKSGALPGGGSVGASRVLRIWNGVNYAAQDRNNAYQAFNVLKGVYFFPPIDAPPTLQAVLINLTNTAYLRVIVNWRSYSEATSTTAFIPAYSNQMAPMTLSDWLAPDGRTLQAWQNDLIAGVAPWPPAGASIDPKGFGVTGFGPYALNGPWHAPPAEALGSLEHVLIGCGVLIRGRVDLALHAVDIQAVDAPTTDAFNAYFFG